MRRFRTYLNEPYAREDGRPLKVRLFWWMLPKSKWYDGTILSWDGTGMAYVQLTSRKKVIAGCGLAHPDMPATACDRDPECGHWALMNEHSIGDRVEVLYIPPNTATSESYLIPDVRPAGVPG